MKSVFKIVLLLSFFCSYLYAYSDDKIYGVTIDDISNIDAVTLSLEKLSKKPTVRIVFDTWQPASYYTEAVTKLHNVSFIMGELLDSYGFSNYTAGQYEERTREYLTSFGENIDIWEIGNEINGEWLGSNDAVVNKMTSAYRIVKDEGKTAALTLYYNQDCWENPENEMFTWISKNIPKYMADSLDYVFVSYYEDDCNGLQPDWQSVFDRMHKIFPNSKLGIGECGTKLKSKKKKYMERYYNMNVNTPNFVGGYFWWYYRQDCVPYTKPLWNVLNEAFRKIQ